jgi:hypothetical protein
VPARVAQITAISSHHYYECDAFAKRFFSDVLPAVSSELSA